MHPSLASKRFLIKEHIGFLRISNRYEIYDYDTEAHLMHARERSGFFIKLLRGLGFKRNTPFNIDIETLEGERIFSVRRNWTLFFSNVKVVNAQDELLGIYKQKLAFLGAKFKAIDTFGNDAFTLRSDIGAWDFDVYRDNIQLGKIVLMWSGFFKLFFTTAQEYKVILADRVDQDSEMRALILGTAICADMVLTEKG